MPNGYRDLIKDRLADRCSRNAAYSLRAFARDLEIEVSQLSRVLNSKQHLSAASARLIAHALFPGETERELFLALVEFETAKKASLRELALRKVEALRAREAVVPLQIEAFRVIADWYHVAILDLCSVEPARVAPVEVASALGISELEAKLALERLEKLGLIVKEKGRWKKTGVTLVLPSGPSSESVRRFHAQMIGKALESVEGQAAERRYLRADTVAVRESDLPEIRALMDSLSKSVQAVAARPGPKARLYQLNMQLFDLVKPRPQTQRRSQ